MVLVKVARGQLADRPPAHTLARRAADMRPSPGPGSCDDTDSAPSAVVNRSTLDRRYTGHACGRCGVVAKIFAWGEGDWQLKGWGFGSDADRPLFMYSSILTDYMRFRRFSTLPNIFSIKYFTCFHVNNLFQPIWLASISTHQESKHFFRCPLIS